MKLINNFVFQFPLVLLCAGLAGCASSHKGMPLGGGYEEMPHLKRSTSSAADLRISLQHRTPDDNTTLIWPSLYGVGEVIHGDMAIFVGDKAYVSPDPNDSKGTKPRLFAVRSPSLPLDITDAVLWRWSKATGKDFDKALATFSLATPQEKNGQLELQLEFWTQERDWPDKTVFQLDWNQVFDIMHEVKEKGGVRKDLRWDTPYIEIILDGKP